MIFAQRRSQNIIRILDHIEIKHSWNCLTGMSATAGVFLSSQQPLLPAYSVFEKHSLNPLKGLQGEIFVAVCLTRRCLVVATEGSVWRNFRTMPR